MKLRLLLIAGILALVSPWPGVAATITGRVANQDRPQAIGGLEVEILGIRPEGEPVTRVTQTDSDGRFRFEDLPAPAVYVTLAHYLGIPFPGERIVLGEGDLHQTRTSDIEILPRTDDASALSLEDARWVLQRGEAGTYRVSQTATFRNSGDRVVVLPEDGPPGPTLPLLRGHGELEMPFGDLPDGFVQREVGLELRGPVFPGQRRLEFQYEIDTGGLDLDTEIEVPTPLATIDFYIRDVGIVIDAARLHSGRPVRDQDGFYQYYFGYEVAAGSVIPLRIHSLPERVPGPIWPHFALAMLVAGACAYYVGQPVAHRTPDIEEEPEDPEHTEKQALFTALRDLEHDYETGKVSTEDHDRLRLELRRDAARALSRLREREASSGSAAGSPAACECGSEPRPGDRFCSGCGRAL